MVDAEHSIPGSRRVRIVHDRDAIEALESEMVNEIEEHGFPNSSLFAIKLAFEEAVTNAFLHGNDGRSGSEVEIEWAVEKDRVCIAIEDEGTGFNPDSIPDPTLEENLQKPGGRGLMLIKSYMSQVSHNARGNRVLMCYERPSS